MSRRIVDAGRNSDTVGGRKAGARRDAGATDDGACARVARQWRQRFTAGLASTVANKAARGVAARRGQIGARGHAHALDHDTVVKGAGPSRHGAAVRLTVATVDVHRVGHAVWNGCAQLLGAGAGAHVVSAALEGAPRQVASGVCRWITIRVANGVVIVARARCRGCDAAIAAALVLNPQAA